ncbi:MAG: GntR family transcriptional regulator [Roseivivax sp.]|nr:GntR family transcriptional regulator [Roseivivax sp.]
MSDAHLPDGPMLASPLTGAPERVYSDLRDRIIRFDLPPGTILSRNALARDYGVSQTPVREALQLLAQDGLVLIYPQSKTLVSPIDSRMLAESLFLRMAVETEVVRRLAERANPADLRRPTAILRMQRALLDAADQIDMFADLDRQFHRALFEAIGMQPLHTMLTSRLGHLYRCQRLELPRKGKSHDIVEAHQAILDGIASGKPDRATAAMREHLSGTMSRIDAIRAEHPDYFTPGPTR